MKTDLVVTKIDAAKRGIAQAEDALDKVLREIHVAPRAEKTAISEVLENAFANLKAARSELVDVETLLREGKS